MSRQRQNPETHDALSQSDGTAQRLDLGHRGQSAPPQSMSVSVPFLTASEHDAARHVPRHTLDAQSEETRHTAPSLQALHDPPQSLSVSLPFLTPSVHVGDVQEPLLHTRDVQSVLAAHVEKSGHGGHDPPQSVAVSVPFRVPFAQEPA